MAALFAPAAVTVPGSTTQQQSRQRHGILGAIHQFEQMLYQWDHAVGRDNGHAHVMLEVCHSSVPQPREQPNDSDTSHKKTT
jgi:hypothetical protein